MANCFQCQQRILFGGEQVAGLRFCGKRCAQESGVERAIRSIPPAQLEQAVMQAFRANCPKCGGPGPVDVHTAHSIMSFILMTTWKSQPHYCCSSCGRKEQLKATASSAVLGWWGFPWGIIGTPIQIGRNLFGMAQGGGDRPSDEYRALVALDMVRNLPRH